MATKSTTKIDKASKVFTDEERAAIQERAKEVKKAARRGSRAAKADGEGDVLAKIAEMPQGDRVMATRLHEIIKGTVPALTPKTWYGMPAYANEAGKIVCYFTAADSSSRATRHSASTSPRTSMRATCGQPLSRSPS